MPETYPFDDFAELGFEVESRIVLDPAGKPLATGDRLANLIGGAAVYVLRAGRATVDR